MSIVRLAPSAFHELPPKLRTRYKKFAEVTSTMRTATTPQIASRARPSFFAPPRSFAAGFSCSVSVDLYRGSRDACGCGVGRVSCPEVVWDARQSHGRTAQ